MTSTGTIFVRTRKGGAALADTAVPMSGGFRRLLGLINGKRDGAVLLAELGHLDAEDLALWSLELMRQGWIAPKENFPAEDVAFSLTMEMPHGYHDSAAIEADDLINMISTEVSRGIEPPLDAMTSMKMARVTRLAVIESSVSQKAVTRAGFFIYPYAAQALPAAPRVCIATSLPAQAKLLSLLVQRAGAVPATAISRDEVLVALRATPRPHVLLLDADMPGIDGFRTLEAIRAKPILKTLRVVLIGASGERADLARALMLGATGYIVKPITRAVMEAALPQILA